MRSLQHDHDEMGRFGHSIVSSEKEHRRRKASLSFPGPQLDQAADGCRVARLSPLEGTDRLARPARTGSLIVRPVGLIYRSHLFRIFGFMVSRTLPLSVTHTSPL